MQFSEVLSGLGNGVDHFSHQRSDFSNRKIDDASSLPRRISHQFRVFHTCGSFVYSVNEVILPQLCRNMYVHVSERDLWVPSVLRAQRSEEGLLFSRLDLLPRRP